MMVNPPGMSAKPDLLGGVAEQGLHEQRQQQRAAQQREAQHEHQEIGDGEGAIAEKMQIDDGILVPPLPDDDEDQRGCGDQGEDEDEVGFEPIVALAFVEDNLQGCPGRARQSRGRCSRCWFR